jgi:hypothetical protein
MAPDGGGYGGLAAAVGGQAFSAEVETLKTFKNQVDDLLAELDDSPAAPQQIADQRLAGSHLGAGFGEASDLMRAYTTVHANLEQLSTTLANQIEAMSITIDANNRGYQNVDEDQVRALWKIRDQTDAAYQAQGTPNLPGAAEQPSPSATRTATGF